jgi:ATP-dependent Clp protease adaptor protein ClpS
MLQVHQHGSAVVAEGSRASMELHVEALHGYGLWATVRQAGGS